MESLVILASEKAFALTAGVEGADLAGANQGGRMVARRGQMWLTCFRGKVTVARLHRSLHPDSQRSHSYEHDSHSNVAKGLWAGIVCLRVEERRPETAG